MIQLQRVSMKYGTQAVLKDVHAQFVPGELVALAGPNGAGKSTLLGIVSGLRDGFEGECILWSKPVERWSRRDLARRLAVVPQAHPVEFPFSAEQVVLMGRAPFAAGVFESAEDLAIAEEAMRLTDVLAFRHRDVRTLSGGERQRVILAAAIAQKPQAMLLDEPTTYLDLRHQVAMYRLLASLCRDGLTVVCATHDLNLAATYASRILLLRDGTVVADGAPAEVLTRPLLQEVFETELAVHHSPSGRPWIFYGDEAH